MHSYTCILQRENYINVKCKFKIISFGIFFYRWFDSHSCFCKNSGFSYQIYIYMISNNRLNNHVISSKVGHWITKKCNALQLFSSEDHFLSQNLIEWKQMIKNKTDNLKKYIAKYNLTNVNIYFRLFNFYYETARANFITLHGFKSLKILKP